MIHNFEDDMTCTITEMRKELNLRAASDTVNGDRDVTDPITTPNGDVSNDTEDIPSPRTHTGAHNLSQ